MEAQLRQQEKSQAQEGEKIKTELKGREEQLSEGNIRLQERTLGLQALQAL